MSLLGGPEFGDRLPHEVWGYAFSRTTTHTVAAGRVRLALLENDLDVFATPTLGPNRRLRPGTYLLTVFGPAKRIIKALDLPNGTVLGKPVAQPYGYFTDYLSQDGTDVHPTTHVTYSSTPTTYTFEGLATRTDVGATYSAAFTCLVAPDAQTCADRVAAQQAPGVLPIFSDAAVAANYTQPGTVPAGTYKRLFEATSGSAGAVTAGFWLSLDTATTSGRARTANQR